MMNQKIRPTRTVGNSTKNQLSQNVFTPQGYAVRLGGRPRGYLVMIPTIPLPMRYSAKPPTSTQRINRFVVILRGSFGSLTASSLHQGEQDGLTDAESGERHQQTVDAHAHAARRGHP